MSRSTQPGCYRTVIPVARDEVRGSANAEVREVVRIPIFDLDRRQRPPFHFFTVWTTSYQDDPSGVVRFVPSSQKTFSQKIRKQEAKVVVKLRNSKLTELN